MGRYRRWLEKRDVAKAKTIEQRLRLAGIPACKAENGYQTWTPYGIGVLAVEALTGRKSLATEWGLEYRTEIKTGRQA